MALDPEMEFPEGGEEIVARIARVYGIALVDIPRDDLGDFALTIAGIVQAAQLRDELGFPMIPDLLAELDQE